MNLQQHLEKFGEIVLPENATLEEKLRYEEMINLRTSFLKLKRSTYTETVAKIFKPYYDLAIIRGHDILIPFESFPGVPTTLYKKVCDGLLYLRNKLPEDQAMRYHLFKARIRINVEKDGIMLHYVNQIGETKSALVQSAEGQASVITSETPNDAPVIADIFARVKDYINNPNGQVFNETRIELTVDQMREIKAYCSERGIASVVEHNKVRIFTRKET